jgi:hypothetical protein
MGENPCLRRIMKLGTTAPPKRNPYVAPSLKTEQWIKITGGISLPIGNNSLGDFIDQNADFMGEQP